MRQAERSSIRGTAIALIVPKSCKGGVMRDRHVSRPSLHATGGAAELRPGPWARPPSGGPRLPLQGLKPHFQCVDEDAAYAPAHERQIGRAGRIPDRRRQHREGRVALRCARHDGVPLAPQVPRIAFRRQTEGAERTCRGRQGDNGCCDGGTATVALARRAGIFAAVGPRPGNPIRDAPDCHLNNANAYHGCPKECLRRFHGVATQKPAGLPGLAPSP